MSVNPRCVKGGSVSSQMCRQKTEKGPRVTNPWVLPAFHSLGPPLPLVGEDTPKGESHPESILGTHKLQLLLQRRILCVLEVLV